jgi:phenolic acid decarboxylase
LILALDGCILKTSIFKDELPRIDGVFYYQKLKILVCFRNDFLAFLNHVKKNYEIIAWQSSQLDYSEKIINIIESTLNF